ncbi:MAG: type I restriction enzyme HsdR N-terminal domain-containing protein [Bacteroidales bacterium]|nr:type I restriction enzyme HsdR N-terminal domain-containing protein [Bacteroidales bacterium]
MPELNLPPTSLKIKYKESKGYVLDRLRKQFVRLTPEEYVRQSFINYLIEYKSYPEGLLANEVCIELGNLKKRCDSVLYNKSIRAIMIIEYKAPSVAVTQRTFDQIIRYNMVLDVPWLIITNGLQHYCCYIKSQEEYSFLKEIPAYTELEK